MEHRFVKEIKRKDYRELHVQLVPLPGETPLIFSEKITEIINYYKVEVVRVTFFGDLKKKSKTIKLLEQKLGMTRFPISWIEGENCTSSFINGVYIFAVSGIDVKRLLNGDNVVGSFYSTESAGFCFLGGLYSDPMLSPVLQTQGIMNVAENILEQAGMNFSDTIRTWYYLDDITSWYDDFNKSRNSFFLKHDIFHKRIPASTGIGGRNETGGKICLELTAVRQKNGALSIETVRSPLQCPATSYGSSFSRALEYCDGEYSNLTISGTSSISPEGITLHVNEIEKQIELTFNVVKAILESRNFSFSDIIRAYAYCRDSSFAGSFNEFCEKNLPDDIVFICTGNKICRDDLLFEIDIDLISRTAIT